MSNGYFIDSSWQINTEGRGHRINTFLMLALVPILGLMFVISLPVIGFYLVGKALVSKFVRIPAIFLDPAPVGTVHLTGHNSTEGQPDPSELEDLSREIQERRK